MTLMIAKSKGSYCLKMGLFLQTSRIDISRPAESFASSKMAVELWQTFDVTIKYKHYCISIVMSRRKKHLHLRQSIYAERCNTPCQQYKLMFKLAKWGYLLHKWTSAQCKSRHQITQNWMSAVSAMVKEIHSPQLLSEK